MQKNMKKYDHHGHPKYCYSFSLARLVLLSNIIIVTPGIVIVNLQVGIVCYPISSSPPQVMLLLFSGLVLQPQVGVCWPGCWPGSAGVNVIVIPIVVVIVVVIGIVQVGVCTVDPALLELVKKLKFKSSAVGEAIVMKVCFYIPVYIFVFWCGCWWSSEDFKTGGPRKTDCDRRRDIGRRHHRWTSRFTVWARTKVP